MKLAIIGFLAVCLTAAARAAAPAIIPEPQQMTVQPGAFKLAPGLAIFTDAASQPTAAMLAARLAQATGWQFEVHVGHAPDSDFHSILLTTNRADAAHGPENYTLTVATNRVIVRASAPAGMFYGAQTLLQLLPPEIFSSNVVTGVTWEAPCVQIQDWPRFKWRGLMLDVSRHFFTKDEVEQVLDAMALHKLNVFHWHLTDDQGWRIEIKKYPKLTSVGAWRDGVGFGLASNSTTAYGPDGRYGGFYTQDEIREVVAYATARHIMVVPEIEIPGHSLAALAAYPEYGTGKGPFEIPLKGGVFPGVYDPAKPETFTFLENILTEVFQLFPSQYVHIGGDEVPPGPWEHDAGCQALMKREGLKTSAQLESWFIARIEKFVNAHGKTLVGWSEIVHGGLPPNAVVMDWVGGGKLAAEQGHDAVMTSFNSCYFSRVQAPHRADDPPAPGGSPITLERVYAYEPVPRGLTPEQQTHILGAQGSVWTEYIANLARLEYMTFPRECALAEVTWSAQAARNFAGFKERLKVDEQRMQRMGINFWRD